ncbi:hypothetical protein [Marinobacterium lacunae]|uniref:hypothetical protein n=1 Tax=Marinobacterium lacunae TaxID=1232683 RepID=UPI000690F88E|nr:hypothetical protein [Marinobacterium lacunae]
MSKLNLNDGQALPSPRVLKIASCPTLTGTSELSYYIGRDEEDEISFLIANNSGGGYFNKEWIAYKSVKQALLGQRISSIPLRQLFKGKSLNTSGFLLAVLVAEGLVTRVPGKKTQYQLCTEEPFLDAINALVAKGVDLSDQTMLASLHQHPTKSSNPTHPPRNLPAQRSRNKVIGSLA